jgi:predicted metal-binding protein
MAVEVECLKCGHREAVAQANQRYVKRGRCGECGGELVPVRPRDLRAVDEDGTPDGKDGGDEG